jgi:DNA modification methylase
MTHAAPEISTQDGPAPGVASGDLLEGQPLIIVNGECVQTLRTMPANYFAACVTSPPYWQKRDYECEGQIGMELTPEDYVDALLAVFDEVHRVLKPDGSLWLNLGDSYAAGGNGGGGSLRKRRQQWRTIVGRRGWRKAPPGYKSKDLTLAPFMVAFALREAGWYLRQTIIWWRGVANEPNRLDRPASAHEYLFQLSKSEDSTVRDPGEPWWSQSVWKIAASAGADGHPAPMPAELARRCIVAAAGPGEAVLDPFGGSGTTGKVAIECGRRACLIELNASYAALSDKRCETTMGLQWPSNK